MENQGLPTLDDLFAENFGDGQSDDLDGGQVSDDIDADIVVEQSDDTTEVPAKLSDLLAPEEDTQSDDEGQAADGPDVLAQEVVLDDGQRVTVGELLRQRDEMRKDYTQKTQELAEQRKQFESERESLEGARDLRNMLQSNPLETIAEMALRAGIIDEQTARAARGRPNVRAEDLIPGGDNPPDIEQLVEEKAREMLEKMMKDSPVAQELELRQAQKQVDDAFTQLQTDYGVEFDTADRNALLELALKWNEPNLEYVYLKAQRELEKKQKARSRVRAAQPKSSITGTQPGDADVVTETPKTLEDAWRRAEVMLGS